LNKESSLKHNRLFLIVLLAGSLTLLSSAPLGNPPQPEEQVQQSKDPHDGKSIEIGRFDNRQDADFKLNALLDFMDKDSKVVNLELKHGFDYTVKHVNGNYAVTIEPFVDDDVLNDVLLSVREHYPDAVVTECKGCVREELIRSLENQGEAKELEAMENAIAQEQDEAIVKVSVEADDAEAADDVDIQSPTVEKKSFAFAYLMFGAGAVLLLILAYILLQTLKNRTTKELKESPLPPEPEAEPAPLAEEEITVVEEEPTPVQVETKEEAAAPVAPETVAEPVKEESPAAAPVAKAGRKLREPNSSITNITKENFKEFAGLRLLVAEDNLINQKVIAGLLKDSGINMRIANDGQECLDILAEDPNYQIILMDAHMPRIDGLEATRLIRKNPAYDHITVMALSGDTGADDIRKMREAGMEEQLEKPLKVDALYQAIYCYFDPNATVEVSAEEVAHLDDALGLEMLGGDLELYHEVLSEFQALYRDSDTKIETWLAHGDPQSAQAILLDVTGIAQSIGAAELTQTAEEFREALIGQQSDLYPKLLKRYRTQLHSILADMAEI